MELSRVNQLSYEDFVSTFGNVVEKCPIVAAAVWARRPFGSMDALEDAISDFIDALPESGREGILRCHPDLAGRDLRVGTLTQESLKEQANVGLDALTSEEASSMARLNEDYKAHFGFPFVICARMNDKPNIFRQMRARMANGRAAERERGIEEVKKICRLRLRDLVHADARVTL
ncbi:2-oxo-4-hydroxy-4-carboxy-5-ureidoimidazoline decarboxylase-like [Entelurus aequoreus]|uniref:2-oxo-4-hydroxy-4-carboxy-5-ureidoimidazoline decarboxylase-like n=1 Tax=Entelurus aequoreus TaxID=161455 RepID=UPI002B1DDC75|nr:2-oxo-4-hydroxy-4-carboxy-5-ureidoimidazoline decarboxylase-like [Entelurus aequoreus]XP_061881115.1 2-oxo-4-hydroxy-4-carboxy-5-ureidoimidazoline decarboxylase-like [Entelurus aequoreus]XP_061881116.1 2-oxo-4-hydroxy-4-carboxy-5-ureidoimidazoline decarboxylase-like [Entelurus aequoreus]XP_061881117.1 2-oxo-4-hydroxy-4-carboxy-5-ureidoimidazoline decarboxylase-like [Entelurus aequoreus]